MPFPSYKGTNILIICIIVLGAWFRLTWYGDLRLSIGNLDTQSYITSSRSPLFSWEMFAGNRLFTTNLVYKLANDEQKCPRFAFSNPSIGAESFRTNQPCFSKIALLQNLLSVFAWCLLAWVTTRWLNGTFIKIVAVTLIILFAFTPQIAEWDSLLSPESFTFSLLMIAFSLLQEIAFGLISSSGKIFNSIREYMLIPAFIIFYFLWIFVRDVHLYSILILLLMITPLFIIKNFLSAKFLISVIVLLIGIFVLGYVSAKNSLRATHYPLVHAFDAYIWPYPQRVQFMEKFDMPARESPEFHAWFDANATKTYGLFLLMHPGFVITTLWDNMDQFTSDFIQPYFIGSDIKYREGLLRLGEMVHPESGVVFILDMLFLIALGFKAIKYRKVKMFIWLWLATWFLLTSAITLVPTYFGDIDGTRRHIFPSVEFLRLFLWIFLFPLLDYSDEQT